MTFSNVALQACHGGLHAEGVEHLQNSRGVLGFALITHLTARFRIERRAVEDHYAFAAGFNPVNRFAVGVERHDFSVFFGEGFVAREDRVGAGVIQALSHLELGRCASGGALAFHRGVKFSRVDRNTAFTADVGRQVSREAIGVVQLEDHIARQDARFVFGNSGIENIHALAERLQEAAFFGLNHLFDLMVHEFGIGFAHFLADGVDELIEEGAAGAQFVAVAQGAAADAAQHVGAAFVARHHTVSDAEGAGADMVSDDLEGRRIDVGRNRRHAFDRGLGGSEQVLKKVNVVVAVDALKHRSNTFETHARVDRGARQLMHFALFVTIELHEDEVPNLHVAVAVFLGAPRRAALDGRTVVIEDF